MATGIRIWEVEGRTLRPAGKLVPIPSEKELEEWIASDPGIIGDDLIIIDKQRLIPGVGKFDLLAMDEDGTLIVIELKRDRTAREAVAQALDYASWLQSADKELVLANANGFLKRSLEDKFSEHFEKEIPDWSCQNHRITLVAPRLDTSADRIITYLSEKHQVDINAVFFEYALLSGGKKVLARTMLLDEGSPLPNGQPSEGELLAKAAKMGTRSLVDICRSMRDLWDEQPRRTYGGSFRYWATDRESKDRVVFGVNVAGHYGPPSGQLDVWVHDAALAEVAGKKVDDVRAALSAQPALGIPKKGHWIRLATDDEANALVQQLRGFLQTISQATA